MKIDDDTNVGPALSECESHCSISMISGNSLTVWGAGDTAPKTSGQVQFQIDPSRPLIIGRAQGSKIPYLDPAYRSTTMMPDGQKALCGGQSDSMVSRGHFMVRAAAGGIVLVNGVPSREGGIRPPINGTRMWMPDRRAMAPGEVYPISNGEVVRIELPNGALIQIGAA